MKAVMYGGGNIGRGFFGALLSQSGYEVTFIAVAEPVVNALRERRTYPVRYVSSQGHEDVWVENVTAVNGNDTDAAAQVIASCDIMATAVGARILKFIVPNIVAGLRLRWQKGTDPLNIIICENLMDANKVLEQMIKVQLTADECALFDKTVGLVEASICCATTQKFYDEHKDAVDKFLEAQQAVLTFLKDNEEAALQETADALDLDIQAVRDMYAYYDFDMTVRDSDIAAMEGTMQFMLDAGMIENAVDISGLVIR